MSFLIEIIPSEGRKYVYALVALTGLVLGSLAVAGVEMLGAVEVSTLQDVYAFVVTATGLMAYANTYQDRKKSIDAEKV